MAYGRGRRSTRRSNYTRRPARGYARRRAPRRATRRRSGGRATRIVIQVVGGAGGVGASPLALGMKAAAPVRARY